jgi:tetratricopeptide (TPR) repeat protein
LALGLIKRGHVYRMQGQWPDAIALYDQAERAAVRANDVQRQADALSWRALAESSNRSYGPALDNATRAVRLAEATTDFDLLARALDVLGSVQLAQLDLAGAAETLSREVTVAAKAREPVTPFYAFLNRSDVHLKRAERCDVDTDFQNCYDALDRARADLQQALAIVRPLGYAALAQQTEGFMRDLDVRRELIKSRQRMLGTVAGAGLFHPVALDDVLVTERFVAPAGQLPPGFNAILDASRQSQKRAGAFALTSEARNYYVEGLAHEMGGNHDAALQEFLKAVEALEVDRRSLRDERSRGTILEDRINIFYAAVQQLLERRRYEEAFSSTTVPVRARWPTSSPAAARASGRRPNRNCSRR